MGACANWPGARRLFDNRYLNLKALQKHWDLFGTRDPLWAILTHPGKKNAGWDTQEFFDTGIWEVDAALQYVESLQPLAAKRRALDFGCGVGRLTQALGRHFEEVVGVDISPSMIALAQQYNRFGERCKYVLNERSDLSVFPGGTFDFIYSSITLQHMPPRYSRRYISEFLRVLAPGGALLFQLTSEIRKSSSTLIGRGLHKLYHRVLWDFLQPRQPLMGMYGVPRNKVERLLARHGGQVLAIQPDPAAEPEWEGFRYLVTRAKEVEGVRSRGSQGSR